MSSATDVSPFDRTYGLALTNCDPELVEAHVPVEERVTHVSGLVHGGVYAAMAETLASLGTNSAVNRDGHLGVGSSNQTSFLRPIVDGRIRGRHSLCTAGGLPGSGTSNSAMTAIGYVR